MQINPEFNEMQNQLHDNQARIAALEAKMAYFEENAKSTVRQTVWQLIGVVLSTALIIISVLSPRIDAVEKSLNQRIDGLEKRIEQSEKNLNQRMDDLEKRIEQSEKNMDKRFEDFKQEMRGLLKK